MNSGVHRADLNWEWRLSMSVQRNVVIPSLILLMLSSIVYYHVYVVRLSLVFPTNNLGVTNQTTKEDFDSMKVTDHPHCAKMTPKTKTTQNSSTPPWFSLLADYNATVMSGRNLYVWSVGSSAYRLGNRLFNYAAVFGIAWRNGRIPILQVNKRQRAQYDLTRHFNLRIPVDQENRITHVSFI